ncbi:hypothetical protein RVX_R18140 [Nitratidesulfovibrio sp. HK-II]|uniref:hypothetical protein n=1 Tax=Nitratidesulfovibrio TaxID=2802295 RepID=UPI0002275C73|nr:MULTISPECIES: hypothetical protein [Nitratidesulfovibrio]EGY27442.1 putative membrane protein [Desulfovibrio sp. A2]NHZ45828.1 hypothetical protein [Nitratidesulfovibrio liaohensis]
MENDIAKILTDTIPTVIATCFDILKNPNVDIPSKLISATLILGLFIFITVVAYDALVSTIKKALEKRLAIINLVIVLVGFVTLITLTRTCATSRVMLYFISFFFLTALCPLIIYIAKDPPQPQ